MQVRIALVPHGDGFAEFFLETVQRVIDNLRMQYPFLRAGQELALEIQSAYQQTVRANAVAALGMHGESSFFGICTSTADKNEGASAFLEKRAPAFHGR